MSCKRVINYDFRSKNKIKVSKYDFNLKMKLQFLTVVLIKNKVIIFNYNFLLCIKIFLTYLHTWYKKAILNQSFKIIIF